MKIGIDIRPLRPMESGGISQLVKGVCERLFEANPEHSFHVFSTPFNRGLLSYNGPNVEYLDLPIGTFFAKLDEFARNAPLDVLLRTYPMIDSLRFPRYKQAVLIPDNQHETFPEFFQADALSERRKSFAIALKHAGAIGTISEFSRKALLDFPDTRCRDIFLMPPALQRSHRSVQLSDLRDSERTALPEGTFFLLPANLWKHKNHLRVLEAFRRFRDRSQQKVELVLTGNAEGWPALARQFPGLDARHLGFVRPEFLRLLLGRASALVFFSLYEGFGIPLLEAFDAGTPVICSNTTSLPEVGGNAVLTCDPTDVDAMASLMQRIVTDEALRAALVMRGRERLGGYSWQASAASLMQAFERVATRKNPPPEPLPQDRTQWPLVSIVTPSYQQGRFLKRTIDSVLAQSYPKIEYIVVDGGSKDESVDILRSYGKRFRWVSEPDGGQTNAINKGMAMASGAIVCYLNSDDILLPDAIERIVGFLIRHPDCDMVYGNADYIDENDCVTGVYETDDYSFQRLMASCMVCQPAAFWRRRIARQVGPFDESVHYAMDYDYWLRIDRAGGNIQFIPDKLAQSRLHKNTKTLNARAEIHRECIRICTRHGGYAHLNFFLGYWHHLMHERDDQLSRVLRRLPGSYVDFGWLHHRWHHGPLYFTRELSAFLLDWTRRRLGLSAPRNEPNRQTSRVSGYFSDCWLGPELKVQPRGRAPGESLYIAGTAPVSLTVSIMAGDTVVSQIAVERGRQHRIEFAADAIGDRPLKILFSDFIVDAVNRKLSFQLQDTNIFTESDVS